MFLFCEMIKILRSQFIFLSLIFFSCSVSHKLNTSAKENIIKNKAFASAHAGICIYEPATGKYWYNYQDDKYFVPASNTKLFTCYAAMKYLGDSIIGIKYNEANDTLFVTAVGDPTFLGIDFSNQPVYNFLKNTNKQIVLNTSLWHESRWGDGWAWNDYNDDYAAERSAMPMYENVATFSRGLHNVQVLQPYFLNNIIYQRSENNYTSIRRDISSNRFVVTGTEPLKRDVQVPFYTVDDSILISLLEDTLHKHIYRNFSLNTEAVAASKNLYSQPTDSLLKITMHRSDNFFAEQSLLMVSAKLLHVMSDEEIIDTLLKTDYKDLPQKPHWVDGSGLSHYNLFSPRDFVMLLNKMKNDFGMERIEQILPTGGTGTLQSYYKPESGYIFAKTGTLSGVVALSGFLYTKKNKLLIFSVLVNNHHTGAATIRQSVEKFIEGIRNRN